MRLPRETNLTKEQVEAALAKKPPEIKLLFHNKTFRYNKQHADKEEHFLKGKLLLVVVQLCASIQAVSSSVTLWTTLRTS